MNMSPKRKRQHISPDSTATIDLEANTDANDSPRARVASRFQSLDIQDTPLYMSSGMENPDSDRSVSPRKRQKRTSRLCSSSPSSTPERLLVTQPKGADGGMPSSNPLQVQMPQLGLPSSPPQSPNPRHSHQSSCQMFDPAQLPSTPIRTPKPSPKGIPDAAHAAPVSPIALSSALKPITTPSKRRKRRSSPSPTTVLHDDGSSPAEKAFCQPKEITGHMIDTSTPDDSDGLGINGIGFQPAPAVLDQRRAKRRAQVSEWRAREAKEDRRRRFEKRTGGPGTSAARDVKGSDSHGVIMDGPTEKRSVRFADPGGS